MVFLFLEYKVDVNFKVYVSWFSSYLCLVVFIGKDIEIIFILNYNIFLFCYNKFKVYEVVCIWS